jgi:hypothetical protein
VLYADICGVGGQEINRADRTVEYKRKEGDMGGSETYQQVPRRTTPNQSIKINSCSRKLFTTIKFQATMSSEFICPCCGFKPSFTEEFADSVVAIVAERFNVPVEDLMKRKDFNGNHNSARAWCIYFLRKFTGVPFKILSYYFDWSDPSKSGGVFNALEKSLQYKSRKIEAEEIENTILEKLSINQPA